MEENDRTWTQGYSLPYTLNKEDRLHDEELGYTLNMMYTLYYEMSDTETPSLSFPEQSAPEELT